MQILLEYITYVSVYLLTVNLVENVNLITKTIRFIHNIEIIYIKVGVLLSARRSIVHHTHASLLILKGNGTRDTPDKNNKVLIFDGKSWVKYDVDQMPREFRRPNDREEFHIQFRTKKPNGIIWFTGKDKHNMYLSLKVAIYF